MYTVLEITSGKRLLSSQKFYIAGQKGRCLVKMAGCRKRVHLPEDPGSANSPPAKRLVQRTTVQKWIAQHDKALNTTVWLKFESAAGDREHVAKLICSVCQQFRQKLESSRNYRPAFIKGTANVKLCTVKEHAATAMHERAMLLLKKQSSAPPTSYAPIAKALAQSVMDKATTEQLKRKFDIAYLIAKENLAFTKFPALCNLEKRHGVDLGSNNYYVNDHACATFIEFIAREQQEKLLHELSKAHFFSLQVDSSSDAANIEEELYLVLYLDFTTQNGKVCVESKYFCTRQLRSGTGEGLFSSFAKAVDYVGVKDWKMKLRGLGCDGTNANMGARGLRGLLQQVVPWVVVSWCLAHRLELSLKDSLKSTFFPVIDELLLQVYYLYEKSPKKCQELSEVVSELSACLEPTDMPREGGNKPLRACGTRFVTHKVAAMGRLIDRYGAYLGHLNSLLNDSRVRPVEKAKLRGYIQKWQNFKVILGCACFCELLKPAASLCKILQSDELCVVRAIESIMKTKKAFDKLKSTELEELPMIKKVILRVKKEGESHTYQSADLKMYHQGLEFIKSHYVEWTEAIESCLKNRIKTDNTIDLFTHTVTLLATNGWQRTEDSVFGHVPLHEVCSQFSVPLEQAGVDCSVVCEEWDDMVEYACKFLNLVQEDYKVIWWKLFNAVDAKKWANVLAVIELLFCLPVANGRLERVFSQLKLIKSNHRTCLKEDTLDQLIRVNVEGPPLAEWDALTALKLWGDAKVRRVNQSGSSSHSQESQREVTEHEPEPSLLLEDWEDWIADTP